MIKIIATEGNTTKWEPVEAGTHLARCVRMVHIGTVMESYANEPAKPKNKVFLTWEFPTMLIEGGEYDGKPRVISKEYSLSLHPKTTLCKHLVAWRGKSFSPKEAEAFDITKLLGVACMITVVHNEVGDKVYANIGTISGLPKGLEAPEQVLESLAVNATNIDEHTDSIPDYIVEKLKTSTEFLALAQTPTAEEPVVKEEEEEELPF